MMTDVYGMDVKRAVVTMTIMISMEMAIPTDLGGVMMHIDLWTNPIVFCMGFWVADSRLIRDRFRSRFFDGNGVPNDC